jgi:hypothetical protein
MNLSNSDTGNLLRLLSSCAKIIDARCGKAWEQDKARQCRLFIKKINRRLSQQSH